MSRPSGSVLLLVTLALLPTPLAWSAPGPGAKLPTGALFRLGKSRLRHDGPVIGVAFSPDGKVLASVGNDSLVRLWDAATGAAIRQFTGHSGSVESVAFAPDGKTLVTASYDRTLRLWEVSSGKELRQFTGHQGAVMTVAFAPDGKTIASEGSDGQVRLWEVATGKELRTLPGHRSQGTSNVVFSHDGRLLATVGANSNIYLWDPATGEEVRQLQGHPNDVNSLDFSPDDRYLASAGADNSIRLWDVAGGKELRRFTGHTDIGASVRFAPGGGRGGVTPPLLASASADRTIRLWDVAAGEEVRSFRGHRGVVSELAFAPDGKTLASAGHDETVRLWDVSHSRELPQSGGLAAWCVAVSPDGKVIVTGSDDGSIRLWSAATGEALPVSWKQEEPITALAFAPDGKLLASVDDDTVRLWDPARGKFVRRLDSHGDRNTRVAFTRKGEVLVYHGSEQTIRLWDTTAGKERTVPLKAENGELKDLLFDAVFSPAGQLLAVAGADRLHLWRPATGREVRAFAGLHQERGFAFSADGRTLATTNVDGVIYLWEVATGQQRGRLQGQKSLGGGALAFSSSGRVVASSAAEHDIRLWDAVTGEELKRLAGHEGPVTSLTFGPGERTLISGSQDGTVLVWDVSEATRAKGRQAKLTPEELGALWTDLGGNDAPRAYGAVWKLAQAPEQSLPLLKERLRQAPVIDPGPRIARLIADLDSEEFAVRDNASKELAGLGRGAEKALSDTLETTTSLEVRRRVEDLLHKLKEAPPDPDTLRAPRLIEALTLMADPEARKLLETLARGAPETALTREAKVALEDLGQK